MIFGIYFLQIIFAIFLNTFFWENQPHSITEAIPMIINLDFFFFIFYYVLKIYVVITKKITQRLNPMEVVFNNLFKLDNVSKNYIALTLLEIFLVYLSL
ncbi:hypothetical protein BWK60_02005 [Flavobacterium covae]|nr:hypothetical protein BWK60_02005 [Flavobacterium covae]